MVDEVVWPPHQPLYEPMMTQIPGVYMRQRVRDNQQNNVTTHWSIICDNVKSLWICTSYKFSCRDHMGVPHQ